jgi:hypothetical protein
MAGIEESGSPKVRVMNDTFHRFPFERTAEAFALAARCPEGSVKTVVCAS